MKNKFLATTLMFVMLASLTAQANARAEQDGPPQPAPRKIVKDSWFAKSYNGTGFGVLTVLLGGGVILNVSAPTIGEGFGLVASGLVVTFLMGTGKGNLVDAVTKLINSPKTFSEWLQQMSTPEAKAKLRLLAQNAAPYIADENAGVDSELLASFESWQKALVEQPELLKNEPALAQITLKQYAQIIVELDASVK